MLVYQPMATYWLKIHQKQLKDRQVDKIRCTWPFQAKNKYDVRLANPRAPGV